MGGMNDDELLAKARADWRLSFDHFSTWRDEAREDFDFVAGDQWSDEDRAALMEQGRVAVTFNRAAPVIDAVAGTEINSRQTVAYRPVEFGDAKSNELLTAANNYFRERTNAEDEESDAFMDMVICGMGWTETRMDFDENLDGEIVEDRIDPLEMFPDPFARKKNLTDGKFVFRIKDFRREEFEERWPGKADEVSVQIGDWGAEEDQVVPVDSANRWGGEGRPSRAENEAETFRVAEYQYVAREDVVRMLDPATGKRVKLDSKRFGAVRLMAAQSGQALVEGRDYVRQKEKVIRRAFFCGSTVLEKGEGACRHRFSYQAMTGRRDRNRNTWSGLVRPMKDPQRWANKFFSQILHIINSNAKGGLLAEADAFEDPRRAEEEWSRADGITIVTPGAIRDGKIQEKSIAQYPVGIDRMMEVSIAAIRDVTGINLEFMGLSDRSQAGVLEYQRKQSGMTILATMFDSLRKFRKEQGKVQLYFIQNYVSDGRLVRIGEEGAEQYVPLIKSPEFAEFDVIVDESPTSPNQKERMWASIQSLLPLMANMNVPVDVWVEIVRYSPLPSDVAQKIIEGITKPPSPEEQQAQQQQQALAQQAQMLALEGQAAKNEKDKSSAVLNYAKAESEGDGAKTLAGIESERFKAMAGAEIDMMKAQGKLRLDRDIAEERAVLDRDKAQEAALLAHYQKLQTPA